MRQHIVISLSSQDLRFISMTYWFCYLFSRFCLRKVFKSIPCYLFFISQRSPLSATQLLWINLIMDSLASFALTRDQPSDDIFKHKPYGRSKPLISRALLRNVIGHSIYQLAVMFLLMFVFPDFLDMRNGYEESSVCRPTQHKTMVFTTFVFMQLFNEINCRRLQDRNVFSGLLYGKLRDINFVFIIVWIASMGIQVSSNCYLFSQLIFVLLCSVGIISMAYLSLLVNF